MILSCRAPVDYSYARLQNLSGHPINRVLSAARHHLEYPYPRLFLVLPRDLEPCSKHRVHTVQWRLYFLCEYSDHQTSVLGRHHIHLANHQGYDLDQPLAFFQEVGYYSLMLLEIYKDESSSASGRHALGLFAENQHDHRTLHSLSSQRIGALVDKAIGCINWILTESQPKKNSAMHLTGAGTQLVRSFLQIPDSDGGVGGLYRVLRGSQTTWLCYDHTFQETSIKHLKEFISSQAGILDAHCARLEVELTSMSVANNLCAALNSSGHIFDISIRLMWPTCKDELESILWNISRSGAKVLEIDWSVTLAGADVSLFVHLVRSGGLDTIILRNYPTPAVQYVFIGAPYIWQQNTNFPVHGLRCSDNGGAAVFERMDIIAILEVLGELKAERKSVAVVSAYLTELSNILSQQKVPTLTKIDIFDPKSRTWQGRLRIEDSSVLGLEEAIMPSTVFHSPILEFGSLRRLKAPSDLPETIYQFFSLLNVNPALRQFKLMVQENGMFNHIEMIRQQCRHINRPPRVTLFERGRGKGEWILTQLVLGHEGMTCKHCMVEKDDGVKIMNIDFEEAPCDCPLPRAMDVLQWNRDRVSGPLTDNDTHILDTATRQHPSILTGFTLDITLLTDQGIASVQNVLGRSKLEYLHIHCEPLKPHMEHSAGKALQAVQWSTIKSLVIFGSDVDSWIRVWADQGYLLESTVGHQLQSLKVIGTGSVCQRLSHSSALALHGFLYGCVLTDLTLDNVQLRVENDWEFIIGAVDFTLIETISMCNTGIDGTNRQKTLLGEHYTLLTPPTEGVLEGPKGPTSPVAGFNVDKDALAVDAKNSKKGGWVVGPQHKIRYSSPSKWKWDGRRQTYFGQIFTTREEPDEFQFLQLLEKRPVRDFTLIGRKR